jgi:hypothetical protein
VVRLALVGRLLALSIGNGHKRVIVPPLFLFILERLEAPSLASSSHFVLPQERSKIAPTASLPKAWLVVMSRSSLVVLRCLHPSLWTRDSHVVPDRKAR